MSHIGIAAMGPKHREAPKSELDSQRALLDALMGVNRNNDRQEEQIRDFRDDRVCHYFLGAKCPHELFVNTRMDKGPCPKAHLENLKDDFEANGELDMYDAEIEREYHARLADVDRAIRRARAKMEEDAMDPETNPDVNPEMRSLAQQISKIISEGEAAAAVDDVEKIQELFFDRYDVCLRQSKDITTRLEENARRKGCQIDKKLRTCDVCGSLLSISESDQRLSDHFMGKLHVGFQYMRDQLAVIAKRREERRAMGYPTNQHDSSRGRHGGYGGSRRTNSRTRGRRQDSRDSRDRRSRSRDRRDRRYDSRDRRHDSRDNRYRRR